MEERRRTPAQAARSKDWTPSVLAIVVFVIFGAANFYVFTHSLPVGNETLVARVLGTIDMAVGLVLGYYFVSSASSESKTETIATMATAAGKQQATTDRTLTERVLVSDTLDVNVKEMPDASLTPRPSG